MSDRHQLAKGMRWAARIIGSIAAVFLVTMLIGAVVVEGGEPVDIAGTTLGLLGAVALAACIASWWWERLAGILLILTAIGFAIHIGVFAGRNHFLAWSIVGLPYLIAGVLLFVSGRLLTKRA